MYTYRPRQRECLDANHEAIARGVRGLANVACTGFGKSICIAGLTQEIGLRTLVLDHRDELTVQNGRKLAAINPTAYIEREDGTSGPLSGDADIIVGSVQALARDNCKRLRRILRYRPVEVIHVDECHHLSSRSYQDILSCLREYSSNLIIIGWTATSKRTDKRPLVGLEEVVFNYPLRQGIEEGWLVDIEPHQIITKTNLDSVRMSGGDFLERDLAKATNTNERNSLIVKGWMDHARGLQTLVFATDVAHVRALTDLFCNQGIKAEMVAGTTPRPLRDATFRRFTEGDTTVLVNCNIVTEGNDLPGIQAIVDGAPTASQLRYIQKLGRGGRTDCNVDLYDTVEARLEAIANSRKPVLKMFDVTDNCTKHSPIMAADIFGVPRKIKLRNTTLTVAVKKLEAAQAAAPSLNLDKVRDIEKLQQMVTEALRVKIWDVEPPKEVKQYSTLSWMKSGEEYRLPVSKHETMILRTNTLGQTEAVLRSDADLVGPTEWQKRETQFEVLGHVDSINEAFQRADKHVENNYGDSTTLLKQNAKWHKDIASDKQIGFLRRAFYNVRLTNGEPMVHDGNGWIKLTKGLASRLISKKMSEFNKAS